MPCPAGLCGSQRWVSEQTSAHHSPRKEAKQGGGGGGDGTCSALCGVHEDLRLGPS